MLQTIRGGTPWARKAVVPVLGVKLMFKGSGEPSCWVRIKNTGSTVLRLYTDVKEFSGTGTQYITLAVGEVVEGLYETTGFWFKSITSPGEVQILAGLRRP